MILGLLKDQEAEAHNLAFELYKSGLITDQVGDIFEELYGKHYSSSQVSRIFNETREEIGSWLRRPLTNYYPIIYIDVAFIPTRRVDSVSKEAYYIELTLSYNAKLNYSQPFLYLLIIKLSKFSQ